PSQQVPHASAPASQASPPSSTPLPHPARLSTNMVSPCEGLLDAGGVKTSPPCVGRGVSAKLASSATLPNEKRPSAEVIRVPRAPPSIVIPPTPSGQSPGVTTRPSKAWVSAPAGVRHAAATVGGRLKSPASPAAKVDLLASDQVVVSETDGYMIVPGSE